MQIKQGKYKDIDSIELITHSFKASILPSQGCKMASLIDISSGEELLAQAKGRKYKKLTYGGTYTECECSGFDDMFPTIDPYYNGEREYADHGEVCRLEHSAVIESDSVSTCVCSRYGDYEFHKIYRESQSGGIEISYEAVNTGNKPLKVLWAAHMMLCAKENCYAVLEKDSMTADVMFSSDESVAVKGESRKVTPGDDIFRSRPFDKNGSAYKFYIREQIESGIRYGNVHVYAVGAPYVGLWYNNGSFKGMYNMAAELCTAGYDTPGAAKDMGQEILLTDKKSWKLFIEKTKEDAK